MLFNVWFNRRQEAPHICLRILCCFWVKFKIWGLFHLDYCWVSSFAPNSLCMISANNNRVKKPNSLSATKKTSTLQTPKSVSRTPRGRGTTVSEPLWYRMADGGAVNFQKGLRRLLLGSWSTGREDWARVGRSEWGAETHRHRQRTKGWVQGQRKESRTKAESTRVLPGGDLKLKGWETLGVVWIRMWPSHLRFRELPGADRDGFTGQDKQRPVKAPTEAKATTSGPRSHPGRGGERKANWKRVSEEKLQTMGCLGE